MSARRGIEPSQRLQEKRGVIHKMRLCRLVISQLQKKDAGSKPQGGPEAELSEERAA